MEQCVVIPLAFPAWAEVVGTVSGLGAPAAWRNPAFVGSLRDANR